MKLSLSNITFNTVWVEKFLAWLEKNMVHILIFVLAAISEIAFIIYYQNHLGLAYNDARSHLDIGRRVVEGLKPGLAQIGSVWLPLPHLLMVLTIWNDFMWHSGLSGALQSMISFVAVGVWIYLFLKRLGVTMLGRLMGVFVFVANINILYMQSTAMTELLLLASTIAASYELLLWQQENKMINLVRSAFWVMLATLNRYDGWFLFLYALGLIAVLTWRKRGYKAMEGLSLFFATLAGLGIVLWFVWNQLIFKDAFYFVFGPYSAHAQQEQLSQAGVLATKGNLLLSLKVYFYALAYNTNVFVLLLSAIGAVAFYFDKHITTNIKLVVSILFSPLIFNILALYLGFSVLFVQGISGDTWFNVRYGILMAPSIAIFIGYLIYRTKSFRYVIIGLMLFVTLFTFINQDAVTIDDARVGSSQKNVSEVSGWLQTHAKDTPGFVLISAASHDAIIFSSELPMSKFIHEGTGAYWISATSAPDRWARWIVMRTNDMNDMTFKAVNKTNALSKYTLVAHYPFADIYELKPEFLNTLQTKPVYGKQK